MGPLIGHSKHPLFEASLCRLDDRWVIATRLSGHSGSAWVACEDPFAKVPAATLITSPASGAPLTAYRCGDGKLRLFTGDRSVSPQANARDPLYCWEIDPNQDFAASNRQTVFDSVKSGVPIRPAAVPKVDFCEALAPMGNTQLFTYRVVTRAYDFLQPPVPGRSPEIPIASAEDRAACGIYHSRMVYRDAASPTWQFASTG
jgi:hypothetical protein